MKFENKLQKGVFLKRYKRFFADVQLDGQTVVAHVPNTGSLKSCNKAEMPCLVSFKDDPERKLKYTLHAIQSESGHWVGVHTGLPNKLVKEAFENKVFPHWGEWSELKAEVKLNAETRIDFVLSQADGKKHYVEVKNVTLAEGNVALFPDAETTRGQKHLRELMELVKKGHTAEILFIIQRQDCTKFRPAEDIDPEYTRLLREASNVGVRVTAAVSHIDESGCKITGEILLNQL